MIPRDKSTFFEGLRVGLSFSYPLSHAATPLGEYRGFMTELGFDKMEQQYYITLIGSMRHTVLLGTDANGIFTRLDNHIEGFSKMLAKSNEKLLDLEKQVEQAKIEVKKPFPREAELREMGQKLAILNAELNLDRRENELADEGTEHDSEEDQDFTPSEEEEMEEEDYDLDER